MVHYYFLGLKFSRVKEDLCDACTRIETKLLNPDMSADEKAKLLLEKEIHLDVAIDQCRTVSKYVHCAFCEEGGSKAIVI